MIRKFFGIAALGLALSAASLCAALAPAAAQTPPAGATAPAPDADNDRLDGAWNDLLEAEGAIASPAQFAALNNLAFQAAAVRVCEGYTLDEEGFGKSLAAILVDHPPELTEEQDRERGTAILVSFGSRYGLFLAEANGDKKDFCDSVAKLKSTPGDVRLYLK